MQTDSKNVKRKPRILFYKQKHKAFAATKPKGQHKEDEGKTEHGKKNNNAQLSAERTEGIESLRLMREEAAAVAA